MASGTPSSQLFIGLDATDAQTLNETIWEQIVSMLTGLSLEQVEALGGVRLYEPWSGQDLRNVG